MSALPFGFAGQCGCGCAANVVRSAQIGVNESIDALANGEQGMGNFGMHAAVAGETATSGMAAIDECHPVELMDIFGSGDTLPIDVAAPRRELDTEHGEGRTGQVCLKL